jgi:choline dehydrogenase-like flavoprotein
VVHSIIFDPEQKKATGVRILDAETGESHEFYSKIIFSCASALGSTQILLNSASEHHPDGLGNSSGQLGHNLMDHHFRCGASGVYEGFGDKFYKGRRPTGFYIARFRNLDKKNSKQRLPERLWLSGQWKPPKLDAGHQGIGSWPGGSV